MTPAPVRPSKHRRPANPLLLSLLATAIAASALALAIKADDGSDEPSRVAARPPSPAHGSHDGAAAPSADTPAARGVDFERYQRPNPTLPGVPQGRVKRFRVDVYEHVTKVAKDLAPLRVWSFAVNHRFQRGTGVAPPIVVNEGDPVEITFVNGASKRMNVTFPHSFDLHAAETAPNEDFRDIEPGKTISIRFTATHPGTFMYHCRTDPMLMHIGAGMAGMMVVKPRGLAPATELWLTQQEYYLDKPGGDPSMPKMEAKTPDVIAFNGYANQYEERPIPVHRNQRIRMYVLNAGPTLWSTFHVIGAVFDRSVIEGTVGHGVQTVGLAPSQGGWVEFTLGKKGEYPFLNHAVGDTIHGAMGMFATL